MRLKNKKTGEIATLIVDGAYDFVATFAVEDDDRNRLGEYDSLAKLNEEWEDVPEEPKEYWIPMSDEPYRFVGNDWEKEGLATGLISLSKEENEKKRKKLKAFKRLTDDGFRFCGKGDKEVRTIKFDYGKYGCNRRDFALLFGGEE